MSTRYQTTFARLHAEGRGAFVPFVTLGDPGPELSLQIIDTLIAHGADALELGFPFSDPLADGPVIQGANLRALAAGTTPAKCFGLIARYVTVILSCPSACCCTPIWCTPTASTTSIAAPPRPGWIQC